MDIHTIWQNLNVHRTDKRINFSQILSIAFEGLFNPPATTTG